MKQLFVHLRPPEGAPVAAVAGAGVAAALHNDAAQVRQVAVVWQVRKIEESILQRLLLLLLAAA